MAKLIITADQMMRLLDTQPLKLPITVKMKGLSEKEAESLFQKIKDSKK
jgi:hypothetical protein